MKKISTLILSILTILFFWLLIGSFFTLKESNDSSSKLQCVSYAPFSKDESPLTFSDGVVISEELVRSDLALLAKYTTCIRTYSTLGLEIVPKIARENGLKMYMGAWVSSDKIITQKEINKLISLAKENEDVVKAVIVGNEVLLRGDTSENQLVSYIKQVKEALPNTKVTYADVWEFWVKHPKIKEVTDFVTIHILPYWEDDPMNIEKSIGHLADVRGEVEAILGDKNILIGETGWPSEGRMREDALPSKINQAIFIREFVKLADANGWSYNIIEAFDQPWKRVSEGAVGGFWGLFDKDRGDKGVLSAEVSNFSNYKVLMFGSIALVLLFSLLLKNREISRKNLMLFYIFNTLFAILFTLSLEQYSVSVRDIWEFSWAALVLCVHIFIYYLTLAYISEDRAAYVVGVRDILSQKTRGVDASLMLLFYTSFILVAIVNLSLAFDGRYRNFEVYIFAISIISFLFLYRKAYTKLLFGKFEKAVFAIILLSSITIFINETYLNIFSNVWVLISLGYAYMLYIGSKKISYSELKKVAFYTVLFLGLFWALKYEFLRNSTLILECANSSSSSLCHIRDALGLYIYLGYFGFTALIFTLVGYFTNDKMVLFIALMVSIGAIVLGNTPLGAIASLAALYMLIEVDS
ncbi:MAG: glycosyl hydrolase [Sulfurimonas denitrificans]|nr:glycosyl hydrolase [Sulfurimonas denitrificans]